MTLGRLRWIVDLGALTLFFNLGNQVAGFVVVYYTEIVWFSVVWHRRTERGVSLVFLLVNGWIFVFHFVLTKHYFVGLATLLFRTNIHRATSSARKILRHINDLFIVKNGAINLERFALLCSPLSLFWQIGVYVIVLLRIPTSDTSWQGPRLPWLVESLWNIVFYHVGIFGGLEKNFVTTGVNLGHELLLLSITIVISLLWNGLSHELVTTRAYLDTEVSAPNTDSSWPLGWGDHTYRDRPSIGLPALLRWLLLDTERGDALCPQVLVYLIIRLGLRMCLVNLHWLLLVVRVQSRSQAFKLHSQGHRLYVWVLNL